MFKGLPAARPPQRQNQLDVFQHLNSIEKQVNRLKEKIVDNKKRPGSI
jgi:hypothetical protein